MSHYVYKDPCVMFVWPAPPMGTRPSNSQYNRAEAGPLSGIAAETKVANMKTEALVSNSLISTWCFEVMFFLSMFWQSRSLYFLLFFKHWFGPLRSGYSLVCILLTANRQIEAAETRIPSVGDPWSHHTSNTVCLDNNWAKNNTNDLLIINN